MLEECTIHNMPTFDIDAILKTPFFKEICTLSTYMHNMKGRRHLITPDEAERILNIPQKLFDLGYLETPQSPMTDEALDALYITRSQYEKILKHIDRYSAEILTSDVGIYNTYSTFADIAEALGAERDEIAEHFVSAVGKKPSAEVMAKMRGLNAELSLNLGKGGDCSRRTLKHLFRKLEALTPPDTAQEHAHQEHTRDYNDGPE